MHIHFIIDKGYPTSAQRVRYHNLIQRIALSNTVECTSYSVPFYQDDPLVRCNIVTQGRKTISPRLGRLIDRFVFPDRHIFNIRKYQSSLGRSMQVKMASAIILGMAPFSFLVMGKYLKAKYPDTMLIADLADPFSFNMRYKTSRIRKYLAQLIESKCFSYFDCITVLNKQIQDHYSFLYPHHAQKFVVLEQGIEPELINKVNLVSSVNNPTYTFLYTGTFYKRGRSPFPLYHAFSASGMNVRLFVYGNIKTSLRPPVSPKIEYHTAVPKDDLLPLITQADALVLVDNAYGFQEPGKTLETLGINKPILFINDDSNSPAAYHAKMSGNVFWCKNYTSSISEAIKVIVDSKAAYTGLDISPYTWDQMYERLMRLLEKRSGG